MTTLVSHQQRPHLVVTNYVQEEVIDFLSDGTEDVNDAAPDEKPSLFEKGCCSSSSSYSEAKNDVLAEIGVTRVRSKRIACQQQKGNAAVKGEGVVC